MKISIVTPVLNDPRVSRALGSIISQETDCHVEMIVIDGGSDYDTLDNISVFRDRIDVLVSESDSGIFDGMNKGIERASGDIVGILNADDRYADDRVLSNVMEAFECSEASICYGNIIYEDAAGRQVRYWKSGPSSRLKWHLGWMPPHPGFFVRREIYECFGTFNTKFKVAADYEMMLRLLYRYNIEAAHLDRVLVRMALGGNSSGSVANIIRGASEVRESWYLNGIVGGEIAALLKPMTKLDQYFRHPSGAN